VDVQSFANNRKEDAIREPIRQNATDFVLSTNDSEKRGICGCAIGRSKNFVDQLFTEARLPLFVPSRCFDDISDRVWPED